MTEPIENRENLLSVRNKLNEVIARPEMSQEERDKLLSIEYGATKNATDAQLRDRATHTGTQTAATISDLPDFLAGKLDAIPGKKLTDENYTAEEKQKLAGLEDVHYKGWFRDINALYAAHPAPEMGSHAFVDDEHGATMYIWDDVAQSWEARVGEGTDLNAAQVKGLYESNPDTNAFTDDEKNGLASLLESNSFTLRRKGTWNATTNAPSLQNGVGEPGDFYVVSVGGTRDFGGSSYRFQPKDWVIYAGGEWFRISTTDALVTWDDVQDKPNIPLPQRGAVSYPIPAVHRRAAITQVIPRNVITELECWTGAGYDTFNMSSDGKRFTVPSWAAYARVSISVGVGKMPTGTTLWGRITVGTFNRAYNHSVAYNHLTGVLVFVQTGIVPVNPGDEIFANVQHNHTADINVDISSSSYINIELFEALP